MIIKVKESNMPMQQALAKGDYRVSGETYIPQAALEDESEARFEEWLVR